MDQAEFEKYGKMIELIPSKINGLVEVGISVEDQAQKFGVPETSVKSWRLGAVPTDSSLEKLDRLVDTVDGLVDQGNKPKRTAFLLRILDFEYPNGFGEDATLPQRIAALNLSGFSNKAIANAAGVKAVNSITHWLQGEHRPNKESSERLENLRTAMGMLMDAGLEPDTAAVWLQSPIRDNSKNIPIDELGQNPGNVFEAIDVLFVRPYKPN